MHHHGLEFQMENWSFALENHLDTGIYIIHRLYVLQIILTNGVFAISFIPIINFCVPSFFI